MKDTFTSESIALPLGSFKQSRRYYGVLKRTDPKVPLHKLGHWPKPKPDEYPRPEVLDSEYLDIPAFLRRRAPS